MVQPALTLRSRWDTDAAPGSDLRIIQVSNDNFASLLVNTTLPEGGRRGVAHRDHPARPRLGQVRIRLRFASQRDRRRARRVVRRRPARRGAGAPQGSVLERITPRRFLLRAE
jgi:hypothetical protein